MSDAVWNAGPAPAWLGEPLLQPGERVLVWGGPRDGRLTGWLRGWLGPRVVTGHAVFLLIPGLAAPFVFAFAGKGLFMLLGWAGGPGYVLGAVLGIGCFFATLGVLNWVGEAVFHVLTDQRFLVIKCHEVVQAFELDVMRRLLAAVDALPASVPTDEHLLDSSKVHPLTARPAEGVTELAPILHMLRAFGQVQAPASKCVGACVEGAPMSGDIGNPGPAPAWLGEPLLQPGERIVVWGGPREGRLKRWLRLVKIKRLDGFLGAASVVGSLAILPFAGIGLFRLLGWADGGPGLYLGLTLALVCVFATIGALIWTEHGVFHVLTDRRLLVIVCRREVTVQAFA
jgi:hypothetical protein